MIPFSAAPDLATETLPAPSARWRTSLLRAEPKSPRQPLIRLRFVPTGLAVLGGVLLWLAFPPHDLSLLAVAGPAALSLAVHRRSARGGAWLGFVLGLAYLVPLLHWSGVYVGPWPWLLLATWQASYLALLGAGAAVVSRLPLWPLWSAALWVADEALRSRWFFGGFPWGRLGFSQDSGPFTALAAYGGIPLLTFAVALTGCLLASALIGLLRHRRRAGALALLGALVVPGTGVLAHTRLPGSGGPQAVVAVVQGNVPQPGLEFNARRRAVLDGHVAQTLALAARIERGEAARPQLVIWPENASDIDPYLNADAGAEIAAAAQAVGVPILVGAVVQGPGDTLRNVGIVWDPQTGPGQTYDKRHPVPFGEYIPYRSLVETIAPIAKQVSRDFIGGDTPGVLDLGGVRIGDVICFEVAYDGLVRDVVDGGARLLVVQTNNATFGYTAETYQQLAMGRLRAVEYGRTVLVAATSGVSAIIDPNGTVRAQSELFTAQVFDEEVAVRSQSTLASRLGAAPEWLLTALGIAAVFAGGTRRRAGRSA